MRPLIMRPLISTLSISGLGPHEHVDLDLTGESITISGASETGKSTVITALCWLLTGQTEQGGAMLAAQLNSDRATVEITTPKGVTVQRSTTIKGSTSRRITMPDGEIRRYTSEADFAAALRLPASADVVRVVLAPMAWQGLLAKERGRPLRDLIARILPPADLRAEVGAIMAAAGHTLKAGDTLTEKAAAAAQRDANAAESRAQGARDQAQARVDSITLPAPVDADIGSAQATITTARDWEVHRSALATHEAGEQARIQRQADATAWDARLDAIGKRPAEVDVSAQRSAVIEAERTVAVARSTMRDAERTLDQLGAEPSVSSTDVVSAEAVLSAARAALAAGREDSALLALVPCGDTYTGTCPLLQSAAAARSAIPQAEQAVADAEIALSTALDLHAARVTQAAQQREAERATASATVAHARATLAEAESALTDARGVYDSAEKRSGEAGRWDASRRALGDRPRVPEAAVAPLNPSSPEPSAEQVREAREALDAAQRAIGALAQAQREAAAAQAAAAQAAAAAKAAATEAQRVRALVAAVRQAPSDIARRQAEALGDLGPVSLVYPESGDAIEVQIDGRPWWCASTGRRVYADACLRAALRRAARLTMLPLIVDDVGAWSGDLPDLGAPVWLLRTTSAGDPLST